MALMTEKNESDDQEIDDRTDKGAETENDRFRLLGGGAQGDVQGVGVGALEQDRQQGGDNVIDQGAGDGTKSAADNDADCHIHHVAAGNERFEFLNKLLHVLLFSFYPYFLGTNIVVPPM